MASSLDKLVEMTEKDGKVVTKIANYDSGAFSDAYDAFATIQRPDFKTSDGLKKYAKAIGMKTGDWSDERLAYNHERILPEVQRDIAQYVDTNFNGFLGELSDDAQAQFAVNYIPSERIHSKSKDSGEESKGVTEYEAARKEAYTALEILRTIEEKGEGEALELELKDITKDGSRIGNILAQGILEDGGRTYLQIRRNEGITRADMALRKYGVTKFIGMTRSELGRLSQEFEGKAKTISDSATTETYATAMDRAQAAEKTQKEMGTLAKRYENIGLLQSMNDGILQPAMDAIAQKKAEKKDKKETKKKGKKKTKKKGKKK